MVVVTEELTLECCREKDLAEGNIGERAKIKKKKMKLRKLKFQESWKFYRNTN